MKSWAILLSVALLLELSTLTAGMLGRRGDLRCSQRRVGRDIGIPPGRNRPPGGRERGSGRCSNCEFVCRCPGDGTEATFKIMTRRRRGRCVPTIPVMANCDRFRWCLRCRTNLNEMDFTGCRVNMPGAPRHH